MFFTQLEYGNNRMKPKKRMPPDVKLQLLNSLKARLTDAETNDVEIIIAAFDGKFRDGKLLEKRDSKGAA